MGETITTPLGFVLDPPPLFTAQGQPVLGTATAGAVAVTNRWAAGDANGDGRTDAGDLSALVLEIFDGDGSDWLRTPGGTFRAEPAGADAHRDAAVDVADLVCTSLILFDAASPCTDGSGGESVAASLWLPDAIQASAGGVVTVPVHLSTLGPAPAAVALALSVPGSLSFDPADANADGVPDAIRFHVSGGFQTVVDFDPATRRLALLVADLTQPLTTLADGPLVSIVFTVEAGEAGDEIVLDFAQDPAPSAGSAGGRRLPTVATPGSLTLVAAPPVSPRQAIYLPFVRN